MKQKSDFTIFPENIQFAVKKLDDKRKFVQEEACQQVYSWAFFKEDLSVLSEEQTNFLIKKMLHISKEDNTAFYVADAFIKEALLSNATTPRQKSTILKRCITNLTDEYKSGEAIGCIEAYILKFPEEEKSLTAKIKYRENKVNTVNALQAKQMFAQSHYQLLPTLKML